MSLFELRSFEPAIVPTTVPQPLPTITTLLVIMLVAFGIDCR